MSVFADAGARIVSHHSLARALADRQASYTASFARLIGATGFLGSRVLAPDQTVADTMQLDLGGRKLELRAWPTSHSTSDLTVFDAATGTLFAGDLLFDRYTPALDGSLRGWQKVMTDLRAVAARQVVPGHGGPVLAWPAGLDPQQRYLSVLAADTRAAIDEGLTLGDAVKVIGQSEASHWQLFELFNPRNATTAFTEMEWE
jgi:quinoprotein relay system zinc metallohydrolase 2